MEKASLTEAALAAKNVKAGETSSDDYSLPTLPSDDIRQIMWRYSDRYDFQMMVQSARSVARGLVANLVAQGQRNTHEWTEEKNTLLKAFDESGITSMYMNMEHGGFIPGPKNVVLALVAFELAWVDGGAATCCLATNLGLSPIAACGTQEQKDHYMSLAAAKPAGDTRPHWRAAFNLTEPLPYVGVETGMLNGKIRIVEWEKGKEPIIQVEKRGRFITNMDFAKFVTAAVDSADEKIKGSCMVIIQEDDPGVFDRGAVTKKMVHQLSSTRDPIFSMRVPASRIIGGYKVVDGVIIPNWSHSDILENVFRRTRVPVGIMTSAKLLSAVEPIIRYQRTRFRGAESINPGSPRYELGIQLKEDSQHRLIDVWSFGEAGASLGFWTERVLDDFDAVEEAKNEYFKSQGIDTARAQMRAMAAVEKEASELVNLEVMGQKDSPRYSELKENILVNFVAYDALLNVLCPAVKLWNTSTGATMLREAVSLMGGYGITEDCPGFLMQKWIDAQLEATYEGPESVQRRHLAATMTNEVFLATVKTWVKEMRVIANQRPGTGACALGTAMQLWLETINYVKTAKDADGSKMYSGTRQGVSFPLADALCWLLAARALILDTIELEEKGGANPNIASGLEGYTRFYTDMCHVLAARATGESARLCADIVYGYRRHPAWDSTTPACCYSIGDLDALDSLIPGIGSTASACTDVSEDGKHPIKAGPCANCEGIEKITVLRAKLDRCTTGSRLAKDRAAVALTKVMIPEALDYPK